jgi:hypothetical protein
LLANILRSQNRIDRLEARAFLRCHPAHILSPPFSSINEHLTISHSEIRIPHSGALLAFTPNLKSAGGRIRRGEHLTSDDLGSVFHQKISLIFSRDAKVFEQANH